MKKFEDLTAEERADICNGCGGKGSWIRPPLGAFFRASCDHHDYGYYRGGDEAGRKACDQKFYRAMVEDCRRLPWYKYPLYRPWCCAYYLAVRKFGKSYFNYH